MQPYVMDSVPPYLRATAFGIYFGMALEVPPYLRATAFGIYFGMALEGQSLMQPVAGYFMDIYGISGIFTVVALVSVGLSLVTLLFAKRA